MPRSASDCSGKTVAQTRCRDACSREELLVIKGDNLGASFSPQVTLEICWHVNSADGFARTDRPYRKREVIGALHNFKARRGRNLLYKGPRGFRSVSINDDNSETADYRMTKDGGQHYEREDRHAEIQDECGPVVQYPTPFPAGNQHETRPGPRLHGLPRRQ